MSETLSDASSRDIQSETIRIPSDMRDFLSKKLDISESDIDAIIPDKDLIRIIENLIQNPENETEKKIFLGKYIYNNIIEEARRAGIDPVDYALSKGKSEDFAEEFDIYLRKKSGLIDKSLVDKASEIISDITKRLQIIEDKVKQYTEQARTALSPEGQVKVDQLVEQKKGDPKFLDEMKAKGYTTEQIQGTKFNATIAGYVIHENADSFSRDGLIANKDTFKSALGNISDTLGLPRKIEPLEAVPIPPGDRRDRVIQAGTEILKTGNYNEKSITYNASTGRITFEPNSPTVMKAEIDTSKIPPILEYVRGSLRIGKDIPPVDPRMKEKQGLEEKKGKLQEIVSKDAAIRFAILGNGENYEGLPELLVGKHKATLDMHKQNQRTMQEMMNSGSYATDPAQAIDNLRKLKTSNHDLEEARKSIISMENLGDPSLKLLEDGLYNEYDGIINLERSLGQYAQNADTLKKYAGQVTTTDTGFEEAAKGTLARLDEMGYGILGQRNLDRIMAALAYNRSSIWKSPALDMKSVGDRDMQLRDLQDVANSITAAFPGSPKTYANAFTEISKRMQSLNTGPIMENLWNNPAALSLWLERKIGLPQSQTTTSVTSNQGNETQPQSI